MIIDYINKKQKTTELKNIPIGSCFELNDDGKFEYGNTTYMRIEEVNVTHASCIATYNAVDLKTGKLFCNVGLNTRVIPKIARLTVDNTQNVYNVEGLRY